MNNLHRGLNTWITGALCIQLPFAVPAFSHAIVRRAPIAQSLVPFAPAPPSFIDIDTPCNPNTCNPNQGRTVGKWGQRVQRTSEQTLWPGETMHPDTNAFRSLKARTSRHCNVRAPWPSTTEQTCVGGAGSLPCPNRTHGWKGWAPRAQAAAEVVGHAAEEVCVHEALPLSRALDDLPAQADGDGQLVPRRPRREMPGPNPNTSQHKKKHKKSTKKKRIAC